MFIGKESEITNYC